MQLRARPASHLGCLCLQAGQWVQLIGLQTSKNQCLCHVSCITMQVCSCSAARQANSHVRLFLGTSKQLLSSTSRHRRSVFDVWLCCQLVPNETGASAMRTAYLCDQGAVSQRRQVRERNLRAVDEPPRCLQLRATAKSHAGSCKVSADSSTPQHALVWSGHCSGLCTVTWSVSPR